MARRFASGDTGVNRSAWVLPAIGRGFLKYSPMPGGFPIGDRASARVATRDIQDPMHLGLYAQTA
jgi:hypothetical protein